MFEYYQQWTWGADRNAEYMYKIHPLRKKGAILFSTITLTILSGFLHHCNQE